MHAPSLAIYRLHCKNKRVTLTKLGYLSCSFTIKQCGYKQPTQISDSTVNNEVVDHLLVLYTDYYGHHVRGYKQINNFRQHSKINN